MRVFGRALEVLTDFAKVMMYYITYVFKMAVNEGSALLLSSPIQYVIDVVMTVPGLLLLDKVGRRPALVGGALFMVLSALL